MALDALALDAKKLNIPDTSGTSGKLSYSVSGYVNAVVDYSTSISGAVAKFDSH